MTYTLWVRITDEWQQYRPHRRRGYTLVAAVLTFDRLVARGTRGVRVLDGQGRQVACFQPGRAA